MTEDDYNTHKTALSVDGYSILNNVIPLEDINLYRDIIDNVRNNPEPNENIRITGDKKTYPMGLNEPRFAGLSKLFTYDILNNLLKELTDNKLIFCSHYDIYVGHDYRGIFHNDVMGLYEGVEYPAQMVKYKKILGTYPLNIYKEYDGESYKIYRMAIYLQDHITGVNTFTVCPGSHLDVSKFEKKALKFKAGDVIIFDARLWHCGTRRTKAIMDKTGDEHNKMAMFICAGRDNDFTKYHNLGGINRNFHFLKKPNDGSYKLSEQLKKVLDENGYKYYDD